MLKVNLANVPERERKSPKEKYHAYFRGISAALGADPLSQDLKKHHPFDLMIARIPPGATYCPYHAHTAQWELYLVISGVGTVRDENGLTEVVAGDSFLFKPGEAHQLSNQGTVDFVYYVIADNPPGEGCYYPDSDKWGIRMPGQRAIIQGKAVEYYEGEE